MVRKMKSVILLAVALVLMVYQMEAQVPKKAANSFSSRYQAAENVKWSSSEGVFKVSFEHLEQSKTASYKTDGTWVKTNIYLTPEELTFRIKDHIKQEYYGAKVVKADLVRTPTSLKYYIVIEHVNSKTQEDKKAPEKTTLIFNEKCEFLGEKEHY